MLQNFEGRAPESGFQCIFAETGPPICDFNHMAPSARRLTVGSQGKKYEIIRPP